MDRILIDVGSSTVKVYRLGQNVVELLETKSIHLKEDFDPAFGLTKTNKDTLIGYVCDIKEKYPGTHKVYATAIFRKMEKLAQQSLVDEFFQATGLYFNIIPHDLEGHYLEMALAGKYHLADPLLLINIGGGSTELLVTQSGKTIERYNLELGVMSVLAEFPHLNDSTSAHSLKEVVDAIKCKLPSGPTRTPIAIYNGGELTYMKRANYNLQTNVHLSDNDHPWMITLSNFAKRNEQIFTEVSLKQLESLMPDDPLWMHGARPCSAIAQAVCEQFGVKTIVPSDSNMAHGIYRQELRQVVLSGSFRKHLDYILDVKEKLAETGATVLSPRFEKPKNPGEEFVTFDGEEGKSPLELERYHLEMISGADALVVCSPNGYVGASALIEIGYAQALGKRVIFTEKPEEFMLATLPAEVGL
ncbi:MAG TPA: hypothetical protein VHT70_04185 [Candidatus Saccharimonadales bacterium]|jgi:nucleoside 2-deoxyribosyltransferase|nr:hypothetical protein [Candidatus Saccharimonadales bacterium]